MHGYGQAKPASVLRPTNRSLCIAMVCGDADKAVPVARLLFERNNGRLVAYRRPEEFMYNPPTGDVVQVILAGVERPAMVGRLLKWLRRYRPGCPIAVVGDVGGGGHEMAARKGGACYLTRPVGVQQWTAILAHAFGDLQIAGAPASGKSLRPSGESSLKTDLG